ncbi:triokinase/FMN cyclase-like isoform X1 [Ceratina calcarata]|uniref:Triokinase/FMN cyclase n=1 Tax=Ceratina calcarata TaxID=156304 RepID=A0AAJ7N8V7_9HYME|nr:triokinase/FMN cyclase-like isoform X1 [Ceratina calcarata]
MRGARLASKVIEEACHRTDLSPRKISSSTSVNVRLPVRSTTRSIGRSVCYNKLSVRTMKRLVNDVDDAVTESLHGLSFAYPQFEYQVSHRVVLIPKLEDRKKKVSLICGGGSGHEPFAAGYVGRGMLTAAVAGSIYAAPPSMHISYAIDRVSAHDKTGILMIVPNYTGDCLNFGIAVERARQEDLNIAEIIVNEDCSIPKENLSLAGKRGLCGIVLIVKVAGALAENGMPLDEISEIAHRVLRNMATYSVGMTACSIPGQPPMFQLAEDEIELGMGVHGEAGHEKRKIAPSSQVVALMLERICGALSLKSGDAVAIIVNNFGALSQLEQGIVVHDAIKHLRGMNVQPLRVYTGLLMTSLNSAGVQITVLNLPERDRNLFLSCLDAPTDAPKWPGCAYSVPDESSTTRQKVRQDSVVRVVERRGVEVGPDMQTLMQRCVRSACEALIREEDRLNDLDRGCGDGDTGSTLKRLATEVLRKFNELQFSHPSAVFSELANIAEERMGGASGGLYCLYLTSLNAELCVPQVDGGWLKLWAQTLRTSLEIVMKYGKAKPGDRSMVDALHAFSETFEKTLDKPWTEICDAVKAATWRACESTKNMKARVGRASYVREEECFQKMDAGAYAVAVIVDAIMNEIRTVF